MHQYTNLENLVKINGFTSNYFVQFFFASSLKSKLTLANKALPKVSSIYIKKTDVSEVKWDPQPVCNTKCVNKKKNKDNDLLITP